MHLEQHGQSMSGGTERRHEALLDQRSHRVPLPAWRAISIESFGILSCSHLLQPAQVDFSLELPCRMQLQWITFKLCKDVECPCIDLNPKQ